MILSFDFIRIVADTKERVSMRYLIYKTSIILLPPSIHYRQPHNPAQKKRPNSSTFLHRAPPVDLFTWYSQHHWHSIIVVTLHDIALFHGNIDITPPIAFHGYPLTLPSLCCIPPRGNRPGRDSAKSKNLLNTGTGLSSA